MKRPKAEYFVGTSGWIYKDWVGRFYPKGLPKNRMLSYYSDFFPAVEINYSFYRLPSAEAFTTWHDQVPEDFRFSVKLSRFLSHYKRLLVDERTNEGIDRFCSRAKGLKAKLGVVLVQLPSNFKAELDKIDNLAYQFRRAEKAYALVFPLAIEARHDSWFEADIIEQLKHHQIAMVINSNPASSWPVTTTSTASFGYIRFHGAQCLYSSSYSLKEMEEWSGFIRTRLKNCTKIYCYFNNDKNARAVDNARQLLRLLAKKAV